jgi:hypothetical protein
MGLPFADFTMVRIPTDHDLTRYHGVFAPNSRWHKRVTSSGRGKRRCQVEGLVIQSLQVKVF